MAILLPPQIGAYAYQAGVRDQRALAAAIAVAMAESAGNTAAHNTTAPDNSYGLWQINMFGGLGPARRSQFGLTNDADLLNPATNARAMATISNGGTNFRPWTTYQGLRYKAVYPAAYAAALAVRGTGGVASGVDAGTGAVADAASGPLDALGVATDYAAAVKNWLGDRHNWIRIIWWSAGVTLVTVGVLTAAGKSAADVTGLGKAAGAVKAATGRA